jgi:ElaB/YqjD/DUF883 family membrane-anchored ribosome-binding protein
MPRNERKELYMTKPNTDATDAINTANASIDKQASGSGEQAKETRAELNRAMSEADAAIRKQQSGSSGTP